MKLIKKIKLSTEIEILTGMFIGDSKENMQIGGIDNSIVRRKDNYQPYIPGSSLKGKIRCLLEQAAGVTDFEQTGSNICKLFGATENKKDKTNGNQSRIIVRDAYLTEYSAKELENSEFIDVPYAEVKFENTIDRILGKAGSGIRQVERVPAGAKFRAEFIINIFEGDDKDELLTTFKKGIELLELDYLGGSGSRGYGQVKFTDLEEEEIDLSAL